MPKTRPGNPLVSAEFGLTSQIPPNSWFRDPPPRDVAVAGLIAAGYRSFVGKSFVGLGLALGLPLVVIGFAGADSDPWFWVIPTAGALFAAFLVVVPAIGALRLARALRIGILRQAMIVSAEVRPPGDRTTIDSMRNGFARGSLRLRGAENGGTEIPFETDARWAATLRAGSDVDVLVDPKRGRIIWILGPSDRAAPAVDLPVSRTMPER
jgi:hypothetical protein